MTTIRLINSKFFTVFTCVFTLSWLDTNLAKQADPNSTMNVHVHVYKSSISYRLRLITNQNWKLASRLIFPVYTFPSLVTVVNTYMLMLSLSGCPQTFIHNNSRLICHLINLLLAVIYMESYFCTALLPDRNEYI